MTKIYKELQTHRLSLRRLTNLDWEALSYLRSDPLVNRYVCRSTAPTKETAIAFISKIDSGMGNQSIFYWVITEQEIGEMIGSICLWNFSKDRKTAEVGYDLHPSFQQNGIMSEALECVINFAFDDLELNSIEAFTHKENESSLKLLIKNGFNIVINKVDPSNSDNVVYELRCM